MASNKFKHLTIDEIMSPEMMKSKVLLVNAQKAFISQFRGFRMLGRTSAHLPVVRNSYESALINVTTLYARAYQKVGNKDSQIRETLIPRYWTQGSQLLSEASEPIFSDEETSRLDEVLTSSASKPLIPAIQIAGRGLVAVIASRIE